MLSKTISKYLTLLWVTCFGFLKINNPRMATSTSLAIPCHSSEQYEQATTSKQAAEGSAKQQIGVVMEKLRLLALLVLMIFFTVPGYGKGRKTGV